MQILESRNALHTVLQSVRQSGKKVGLVPTMGNLHEGHLSLIDTARQHSDFVVATIFVNPLQFGEGEDLTNYPRTLDADCAQLSERECDAVFIPGVAEMYPQGLKNQTLIRVPGLSAQHCGASRPGHFDGVCTVVCKLFNLVQPDLAFFGEKDFQQLQIIRKMTADLCLPISIHGVPVVRNAQGLALSSRNNYLNSEQLSSAEVLNFCLRQTAGKILEGEKNFQQLEQHATATINAAGLKTDYFTVCNAETLEKAAAHDNQLVVLAAAFLGTTRLIDNTQITL